MKDPTYVKEEIEANPVWALAFSMSEIDNDNAPIGWGRYISLAHGLLANYEVTRKGSPLPPATRKEPDNG
jgi:hypothetical protein